MNDQTSSDTQAPGYLGRILDSAGEPQGTCFEIEPGILITAWHVLDAIGIDHSNIGANVAIDGLAGQPAFEAELAAAGVVHDLAILTSDSSLGALIEGLALTDGVELNTDVVVAGVSEVNDSGEWRYLTAPGRWAGPARKAEIPLARVKSSDIMPGMSGAPVCLVDTGHVVGVVASRFNSADGWLRDSVLVVRIEDLEPLLRTVGANTLPNRSLDVVGLRFSVDDSEIAVTGRGVTARSERGQVSGTLVDRVNDLRKLRTKLNSRDDADNPGSGPTSTVSEIGRMLAKAFLPEPIATPIADTVKATEGTTEGLPFGIETNQLSALPWEVMAEPGSNRPLALCPTVNVYRQHNAGQVREIPGPLRVIVAIASPIDGGGELLDYERELRNVMEAFRSARHHQAHVRIVPFATTAAIRQALTDEPAHVLHLTGHGTPGKLILETDTGEARPIDAETFVNEAIPADLMPPLVTLAACYTNTSDEPAGLSFAETLLDRGAAAVIATETSVTDIYSTRLLARVYGNLAAADTPEIVSAVADARRAVQQELQQSDNDLARRLAALEEWATVTILANGPTSLAIGEELHLGTGQSTAHRKVGEVLARDPGDFVGRRSEQRLWPQQMLTADKTGKILYGIGGVGKTTLATELARRCAELKPSLRLIGITGPVDGERLLRKVATALQLDAIANNNQSLVQILDIVLRTDLDWATRFGVFQEHIFPNTPLLVVLDNFEDNLTLHDDNTRTITDPGLGMLLSQWVQQPGQSRLLFTTRHPFTLPDHAERALDTHQLGPLSIAETRKLMWALPNLDSLTPTDAERVWRLLGGHPRSLEYLDALLAGGGRFPDITTRIHAALTERLGEQQANDLLREDTDLDTALTETIALAADDILLGDLLTELDNTPGARQLVTSLAVYRRPVDLNGILHQTGTPNPDTAHTPNRKQANEAIQQILDTAGIELNEDFDPSALPPETLAELVPHFTELRTLPRPGFDAPADLDQLIERCQTSSLLSVDQPDPDTPPTFFVHRWTADELARTHTPSNQLLTARQQAAAYWQWRAEVWPQDTQADTADLLEARHHHIQLNDLDQANQLTEHICSVLDDIGAWDQAEALIHETRNLLPDDHPRQPAWIHQLAKLAHQRGDYEQAETRYQQSLTINERLGNQASMASSYHNLGAIAQARGDYEQAESLYQQALTIIERLGDQTGMASSYHQLGTLAQAQGDYEQAETRYQQSLTIEERLGNQTGIAASYHQLGVLAHLRGDNEQAETRYQQSLTINERLGNQASMASGYHNLGQLAQARGDYEQAETRYQQSLTIKERLGNQTGMASSYQQLGILAQARGDYEQAETRYQQSLTINERLGNQAGIASSYSTLGGLALLRNQPTNAVPLHIKALLIRTNIGVPQAANNLRELIKLRKTLDDDAFTEAAKAEVDQDTLDQIVNLFDQLPDDE